MLLLEVWDENPYRLLCASNLPSKIAGCSDANTTKNSIKTCGTQCTYAIIYRSRKIHGLCVTEEERVELYGRLCVCWSGLLHDL